ncbi:putative glycoside hydrolase [Diplodia seriata]|uniref:beta-N-acetylhexosaminidase n=1 Tax=Diplodia seriata TaxID=420778 RepID=A0A0G2ER34_9PEZI|nr:putative glycoside hydrolase [Diplodia seriata]
MLDAGRKYYAPSFLKELCTYASFFKLSEFHYHLSDNYPLNRGHNETWNEVYSHFSLLPEDESLHGIIERPNETLSRTDFSDFQQHCASHGVTVIPEIEAPGHCLYLTKWKPEMALDKKDLLNLSHPEAIPTVKRIWSEFLPWFETKEVHIGADEYDSTLADDYIGFVNEMSSFIQSTSNKTIRIWGTEEPSENLTISKDVIIQHWQYGQSDPVQLHADGYSLINSEDWWAYMSLKNDHMPISPAPYPQLFNTTRVLNFADEPNWQWTPADYNPVNTTQQLRPGARGNKGAILAAWNDNGPDATTQLEAYYAMRQGIPLVGARAWSGSRGANITLDPSATVDALAPRIPGQNLDRRIKPSSSPSSSTDASSAAPFSWTRGANSTTAAAVTALNAGGSSSVGLPHTLRLTATGPFALRGPDTLLALAADGSLVYTTADGWPYPLRSVSAASALDLDPGQPGRIWVNDTTSTHEPVRIDGIGEGVEIVVATDAISGSTRSMRLLNARKRCLESFADDDIPPYSILSHRWRNGEVLYEDLQGVGRLKKKEGHRKLKMACKQSLSDGYDYIWIDTCCIDKSSSAELSESINSMFAWYSKAEVCYAYLFDVPDPSDVCKDWNAFGSSEWFKRGWTLQELIAPSSVIFYSQGWIELGSKFALRQKLARITGINAGILTHAKHLSSVSVAQKMSWASKRVTSRLEDTAYCLMGLFNVNMPMLYGEGEKAFTRLQEEIMKETDDESLFAWLDIDASPGSLSGLLAKSPANFAESGDIESYPLFEHLEPFAKTNKGLRISFYLKIPTKETDY